MIGIAGKSAVLRLFINRERVGNPRRLARRGRPGVVVFFIDDARLRLADLRLVQATAFCRTQAVALRVSLVSLGMQALWDAVLMCGESVAVCAAAVPQLFSTFTTVAFLELIVFCVIEMRYLLLVWQAHDPQRNWDAAGWCSYGENWLPSTRTSTWLSRRTFSFVRFETSLLHTIRGVVVLGAANHKERENERKGTGLRPLPVWYGVLVDYYYRPTYSWCRTRCLAS